MKATARSNKPTKKVNIAVVGLGFMGVTHIRAYLDIPEAHIAAVCDSVRLPVNGILAGVAGNVKKTDDINLGPQVKVFRKLEEVLADPEVQFVDICTPTPLHPEQAIAALKAGKNVLCEKPLARTSALAREILKAQESAPGFLMPAMCMRFWPGWSWLKKVVEEKTYGKVLAARFRLHIHDTDFVNFLFGRPKAVFSTGVMLQPGGSVDHVMTQYLYPNGPLVHAEGGWLLAKGFNMAYTLLCERATLDFDLARGPESMQVIEAGQSPRTIAANGADGYTGEVRYVVDCAVQGKRPAIVTAQDGLTALEICEAEEKSVRTGQVVAL